MKADLIIKNAKIFTSDRNRLSATALVVKDGKFAYVGDESGLSSYEGEVTDLGGRFIMPAIIDSHVHVTLGAGFEYTYLGAPIQCGSKKEALDYISEAVRSDPGQERYRFMLDRGLLCGEDISKEELDQICPDSELLILEEEGHSVWVNSRILLRHNIRDDTPDPVPGLDFYVRRDAHLSGNVFEAALMPFLLDDIEKLTDEEIDEAVRRWIGYSVENGVCAVFDAGIPEGNRFHERVYSILRDMDRQGKLPVFIDGCYVVTRKEQVPEALRELRRMKKEFNTEHLKVHTLKIFMDGTLRIETAALVTPYEDTGTTGTTAFNKYEIAELLKTLNEDGLDLHLHTVGEAASRAVLDGVETARKELQDDFKVHVTCAHLEIQDDADLERFAKLNVTADFTPCWHAGNIGGDPGVIWSKLLGRKRAESMYRCKTLWDSGALVTWSSDEIIYDDFTTWNPYFGMEVGMTRQITEKTRANEWNRTNAAFPPASEKMNIEEMILGYTINGAKQLGIEASKGSIEAGKDADFLIFDKDLLSAEHEGFSFNRPAAVYFGGVSK